MPHRPPPNLTTERLRINQLTPDDAASLHRYRAHAHVRRFQTFAPASPDEAKAFILSNDTRAFDTPDAWCQLAIRNLATDELIGDLAVRQPATHHRQAEFGVTIDPERHHNGYATEACIALLDHLFSARDLHRVFASVDPENTASIRLLTRLAMRQEAHFRQSCLHDGNWTDDVIFAMLQSEWRPRT